MSSRTTTLAVTESTVSSTAVDRQRLGAAMALAAVGSVAANAVIAAVAVGPLGASAEFQPLTPAVFALWTVVGAVIGAIGWRMITRRAAEPSRLLTWLVPTVVAVSLIPDAAVYLSDSMPGTSGTAVLALVAMHLATAAIAVLAYRRFLPASR